MVEDQEVVTYHGARAMVRILWEKFKREIHDQYFQQQKSKNFANLVHVSMTIEQYTTKLMKLGRV